MGLLDLVLVGLESFYPGRRPFGSIFGFFFFFLFPFFPFSPPVILFISHVYDAFTRRLTESLFSS